MSITTKLRRDACQRNEPDGGRHRLVIFQQPVQPEPAGQREGQGRHDQQRLVEPAEPDIEQYEDDQQCRGHHRQPFTGALAGFELLR